MNKTLSELLLLGKSLRTFDTEPMNFRNFKLPRLSKPRPQKQKEKTFRNLWTGD